MEERRRGSGGALVDSNDGGLLTLDRHSSGTPWLPLILTPCTLQTARGGARRGEEARREEERGREIGW